MFYEAVQELETLGICRAALMPYSSTASASAQPSAEGPGKRPISGRSLASPLAEAGGTSLPAARRRRVAGDQAGRWGNRAPGGVRAAAGRMAGLRATSCLQFPRQGGVFDGGHGIVLVGHADDPKPGDGGMFTFRNSNGPEWGSKKGYGRMSYAYVPCICERRGSWLKFIPGHAEAALGSRVRGRVDGRHRKAPLRREFPEHGGVGRADVGRWPAALLPGRAGQFRGRWQHRVPPQGTIPAANPCDRGPRFWRRRGCTRQQEPRPQYQLYSSRRLPVGLNRPGQRRLDR